MLDDWFRTVELKMTFDQRRARDALDDEAFGHAELRREIFAGRRETRRLQKRVQNAQQSAKSHRAAGSTA